MPTPHRQPLVLSLSAKVSIASNAVVLLVVALLWADVAMLAPFSYNVHKALHLVGVMLMTPLCQHELRHRSSGRLP